MIIDVINLEFKELNFPKKCDKIKMQRAKQIYEKESVKVTKVDKKNEENFEIDASAEENYNQKYDIKLNILKNTIKEYSCTCKDYNNGHICKHILATKLEVINPHTPSTEKEIKKIIEKRKKEEEEKIKLYNLQLEEEKKEREYQEKYSVALNTIRRFKRKQEIKIKETEINTIMDLEYLYDETKKEQRRKELDIPNLATEIKLEPKIELEKDNILKVAFKIGEDKMYTLSDIQEFYKAFVNEEIIQYGKNFRFEVKKESFEEQSQGLLDFILNYGQLLSYNEKINKEYYYGNTGVSNKYLYVMDEKIDEFFSLIKKMPILVTKNQIDEKEYKITNKDIKIFVEIEENEQNEYKLEMSLKKYEYLVSPKNIYIFWRSNIHTVSRKKHYKVQSILEMFKNTKIVLIPKDKINEFKEYVFPEIIDYVQTDMIPEKIEKEGIVVNKLASKINLDLDEKENIILELKFCYSNYEFNILDNNLKDYIAENNIVRDTEKEIQVLKTIFMDGFVISNDGKYFILEDEDKIYDFLLEKIAIYMNEFEVLVTEKLKNRKVTTPKISKISIKLEKGLLELNISKINIDFNEIKDILKSYNVNKRYYKLKNGDYINLEKNEDIEILNDIQNILDVNYEKLQDGILKIPINRGIYLEKLLSKTKGINETRNEEFARLINSIENKNFSEKIKIKSKFEEVLRDYQKIGYKWLKVLESYNLGGVLADDMGLGKTLQIIALIASQRKTKDSKPSIVVCPGSLVLNWKAETEKWAKDMKVLAIKGEVQSRRKLIKTYKNYDLIITSYDALKRDILEYKDFQFKYIIADEAQYIKNFTTQNATSLKNLVGETRYALTGTPIENSVSELWSIFDFIMPDYLYSYNKFKTKFEIPILKENNEEALKKLKLMIKPFILRRMKSDVLTELPEKNITIMNSEMTKEQENIYNSYLAQTKKEIVQELKENGFERSRFKILVLLTRLRQICCHPRLFINDYKGESGKLNQCMDIICDAIASGHKILLFSSYTSMFKIIEERLKKENINYYKLTGNTPVNKRVDLVEKFNKDENAKIFLISLKAGGTGLNLTSADVVIHYDPWWNISSENQATDRAYRIGQKNSVQVYKLITNNSIEEKINKLQEKKAKISEQVLSNEQKFLNRLTKEEILQLFQ